MTYQELTWNTYIPLLEQSKDEEADNFRIAEMKSLFDAHERGDAGIRQLHAGQR